MTTERRSTKRSRLFHPANVELFLKQANGEERLVPARVIDVSAEGMGVEADAELEIGAEAALRWMDPDAHTSLTWRRAVVAWRRPAGGNRYRAGLCLRQDHRVFEPDYYERLQLSPNADLETIQKVYTALAVRYHPENPATGDQEIFERLVEAYLVLSDREARASYDCWFRLYRQLQMSAFESEDPSKAPHCAWEQRLRILQYLLEDKLFNPSRSGVACQELAEGLALEPELLEFHLWYLSERELILRLKDGSITINEKGAQLLQTPAAAPSRASGLMPAFLPPVEACARA